MALGLRHVTLLTRVTLGSRSKEIILCNIPLSHTDNGIMPMQELNYRQANRTHTRQQAAYNRRYFNNMRDFGIVAKVASTDRNGTQRYEYSVY
jgi:hypothetical protein